MHEAKMHEHNCFVTLTYSDEYLPINRSVNKRDVQLFLKRLRKRYPYGKIGYYFVGEYGEETNRPHYHGCLFNVRFEDAVIYKASRQGHSYYISETLNRVWGLGYCVIGELTFDSAAYVARYVMKKITGDKAESHYSFVDSDTGEIFNVDPEFQLISSKPAPGLDYFREYKKEIMKHDSIIVNGKESPIPKYYTSKIEEIDVDRYNEIKKTRMLKSVLKPLSERVGKRLWVKESVKIASIKHLKRTV